MLLSSYQKIRSTAFARLSSQSEERKLDFKKWISKNSWVEDYATFDVIRGGIQYVAMVAMA